METERGKRVEEYMGEIHTKPIAKKAAEIRAYYSKFRANESEEQDESHKSDGANE